MLIILTVLTLCVHLLSLYYKKYFQATLGRSGTEKNEFPSPGKQILTSGKVSFITPKTEIVSGKRKLYTKIWFGFWQQKIMLGLVEFNFILLFKIIS